MPARLVAHALALAQTLIVAQFAVGLLLLADHRHADKGDALHVREPRGAHGRLAVVLRAADPRRRLAWFAGATLLAAVLAVRAYMTA